MAQPYAPPCSEGLVRAEPRQAGREIAPARRRVVLAACILASSMAFIDGSALTVALPTMRRDLETDLAALQWVLNAYVLALASLTLIGGALGDAYGKARMLALGCAVFGAASVWCALAPDVAALIAARAAQGIGAAILTPASLALIGAVYPEEERGAAIGAWAAASALTTAGGPVLGGWLVETFDWRAVFWINPPLAVGVVALVVAFAPKAPRIAAHFDILGALLLAAGLGALAYGLSVIEQRIEALAFAAAIVLLAAFVGWQARARRPMTPLAIFRNRMFAGLNAATLFGYAALSIMFFLAPFHLADLLSATEIGLVFLPFTLGVGLLSQPFGKLATSERAPLFLVAGPAVAGVALAWMAIGAAAGVWAGVVMPMALLGLGFAIWVAPLTSAVMASLGGEKEGLASGVNNGVSRIAQLVGVAGASALGAAGYAMGLWIAAGLAALAAAAAYAASRPQR